MKKHTIKSFSRRFSFSDWTFLLSHDRFERAVEAHEWEAAEVIAREILDAQ